MAKEQLVRFGRTRVRPRHKVFRAQRLPLAVVVVTLGFVLASCDWTGFGFNPAHSRDNESDNTITASNVSSLALRFMAATGDKADSSPAVAAGVLYIGVDDHKLYAFDAAGKTNCATGTPGVCAPLWTGLTGGYLFSSPVIVNGVAYVGTTDHLLYAFDATGNTNCSGTPKTCAPLWTADTHGVIPSSPVVSNGVVYVAAGGSLNAFDATGSTNCSGT